MAENTMRDFVARSLEILQCECTMGYNQLCERLAGVHALLELDGEQIWISAHGGTVHLTARVPEPDVRTTLNRELIRELLQAEVTLLDAALEERFLLSGPIEPLLRFHDALTVFFAAAARCPSFPSLLSDFLEVS